MAIKLFLNLFFTLAFFLNFVTTSFAQNSQNNFVNIVNPIRGSDFWEQNFKPTDSISKQYQAIEKEKLSATWLLRYDALKNKEISDLLKTFNQNQEFGILFEVTPTLTKESGVEYRKSPSWHHAASVFLTGYSQEERVKLIDQAFEEFRKTFKVYPKSVGAWWIDSYSLNYMRDKYKIDASLDVADQFSTDGYQVWGQYFSTPFYPSKDDALITPKSKERKIDVVVSQWAARDPYNGYGERVEDSTYSVQSNDYLKFHNLDINYFDKLLDIYTNQPLNDFGQLVIGLENDFDFNDFGIEYQKQLELISQKRSEGKLRVSKLADFAIWYKKNFPDISPTQLVNADDPLGSGGKVLWYQSPFYRLGFFANKSGAFIRDLRVYNDSSKEPCLLNPCSELNFAFTIAKALDDVTHRQKYTLDEGEIKNFRVSKNGTDVILNYTNAANENKSIRLLQQDLEIDGKIHTVSGLIINATSQVPTGPSSKNDLSFPKIPILNLFFDFVKTILLLTLLIYFPGRLLVKKFVPKIGGLNLVPSSIISGFSLFLLGGLLFTFLKVPYLNLIIFSTLGIISLYKYRLSFLQIPKYFFPLLLLLSLGSLTQSSFLFRNGLDYQGLLFFFSEEGINGLVHLSQAVNLNSLSPNASFFSGEIYNRPFLLDLFLSQIKFLDLLDLYFRFLPLIFSFLAGTLIFYITTRLSNRKAGILAVFFYYFAFDFAAKNIFWVKQATLVNTQLNTTFNIILILSAIYLFLLYIGIRNKFLIWLSILSTSFFLIDQLGTLLSFNFTPFWFVKTLLDSPDHLGNFPKATARFVYETKGESLKLAGITLMGLVIFYLGILGVRVLGLLALLRKNHFPKLTFTLLLTSLIFFLIPQFFTYKLFPEEVKQYFYFSIVLNNILLGMFLGSFLHLRLQKLSFAVIGFLIIISLLGSYINLSQKFEESPTIKISSEELSAFNFLKEQKKGGVISLSDNNDFPFMPYFSSNPYFLNGEKYIPLYFENYSQRVNITREFFYNQSPKVAKVLKEKYNIKYIYLEREKLPALNERKLNLKKISENEEFVIYQLLY
ncbi:hypothetical protein HYS91_05330 [Candidatus Daviesbacteria bacterium]|nr:hypothetical protein [Candidatus Daviesbacteria bacterium]